MSTLMSIVGAVVFFMGLFFAGIAYRCDTTGEFVTPWWSGSVATYSCVKKEASHAAR